MATLIPDKSWMLWLLENAIFPMKTQQGQGPVLPPYKLMEPHWKELELNRCPLAPQVTTLTTRPTHGSAAIYFLKELSR